VVWLKRGATPAAPKSGMPAAVLPPRMMKERLMAAVMIGVDPPKGLPLPEPAAQEPAIGEVLALLAGAGARPPLTRTGSG
jgi:hypothetical protein